MVFRCRPKPNLAAAKKAQISKAPPSSNEAEKQITPVKDLVDKKPVVPVVEPVPLSFVIKPEAPAPAPAPASTHEGYAPTKTIGEVSVTEIPSSKASTPLDTAPAAPVSDIAQSTVVVGPSTSNHAVPRPPAKITADNSLSSVEESESPLFIPQKSQMPLLSPAAGPTAEVKPSAVPDRTLKPRKVPVEHAIDLDEADNEASDEEKPPSTPIRKRRIEDVLSNPKVKKLREYSIRTLPMISGPPDRSKVKMRDLIYRHNQTEPPPQYRQERELKLRGRRGCLWMFHQGMPDSSSPTAEEPKDDKPALANSTSSPTDANEEQTEKAEKKPDVKPAQTQFVMDADGNIVLNEESLVIRREYTDADYIDIKQDSFMGNATYSSYRAKRPRSKKWSVEENVRLYKALSTIGTDFSCMVRLFKNRSREEIKRKFKREEKARPQLIDHVLSNRKSFDLSLLDNPEDDVMPVISDDSDSSSDSVEDVLQKAVLLEDGVKEKLQRRAKRMKRIDLDPTPIPANPNWFNAKTAYQPDPTPARKPKPNRAHAFGLVDEAEAALRRSRGFSMDQPVSSPAPAPSPCPSAPGAVEDVLTRLIGQKMRDVNQRPITPVLPSPSSNKSAPLAPPAVRNSSLSLTEFCKMEAHLDA